MDALSRWMTSDILIRKAEGGMHMIDFTKIQLFDGAMGTRLLELGFPFRPKMEELNITHPEIIERIHQEYIEAHADFITTATFGVNGHTYQDSRFTVKEVVQAAIVNAKKHANQAYIVLDIGPIGKLLEPYGDMREEECHAYFKEIIDAGKNDVDAILFETFMDIEEIKIGIRSAKENSTLPIFATMTFNQNEKTMMGVSVEDMVDAFETMGVDALGVNCSWGPRELIPIVEKLCSISKTPVIVQPNAGMPCTHDDGSIHYLVDAQEFCDVAQHYVDLGVKIIGGCCGTDSETIRQCAVRFKK
jgi:5-methyltetrahydrofolate--homocysteine methyltransferase